MVDLRSAGVPVGLGVDGAASNESGALFPEIRQAVYLARLREGRPDALSPEEGLEMATVGGAKCIGRPELGTLEVGSPAAIAVWPGGDLEDVEDALAGLVLGPDRRVRHLFVGGRMVVEDGMPVGFNLDASHRELARRAKRLFASD